MRFPAYFLLPAYFAYPTIANVEKTIFTAPEAVNIPQQQPSLASLHLEILNPIATNLRRELPAAFPLPDSPKGTETWFLLDGLRQYQRYEVRICWPATVCVLFLSVAMYSCRFHDFRQQYDITRISLKYYSNRHPSFLTPSHCLTFSTPHS